MFQLPWGKYIVKTAEITYSEILNRNHYIKPFVSFIFTGLLSLISLVSFSQTTYYSASGGAWADGGTWVGGIVPGVTDNAVIQEGHTLVYEPDAMVRHIHRREYNELKTQIRNWGTAFIAYLVRSAMAYPEARSMVLFFMVRWFIGRHLIRMLRHLWGPQRIPFDLMMAELAGSLTGLFAYQRACRNLKRIEAQLAHRG